MLKTMSIYQYTNEELVEIHFCFYMSGRRREFAQQLYRDMFPDRQLPSEEMFEEVHQNLRGTGSFSTQRQRLLANISPNISENRRKFCHWFNNQEVRSPGFSDHVLFTDESEFKGNGYNHNFSLNVWCGIVGKKLVGPFFLPLKLTGLSYLIFLNCELMPVIRNAFSSEDQQRMWFMHDGAPPHKIEDVKNMLNENFPNRWIGNGGTVEWPSQSPDLNPMDFYVWGCIKQAIDVNREINTLEEFKAQIYEAFDSFRQDSAHFDMTSTLMDLVIAFCIEANGGVIKRLLQNFHRRARVN